MLMLGISNSEVSLGGAFFSGFLMGSILILIIAYRAHAKRVLILENLRRAGAADRHKGHGYNLQLVADVERRHRYLLGLDEARVAYAFGYSSQIVGEYESLIAEFRAKEQNVNLRRSGETESAVKSR